MDWKKADKVFASPFLSLEKDKGYELVLSSWRLEERKKFKQEEADDETGEKETVLAFDVLKVNNEEFTPGALTLRSASSRLYNEIKPILQAYEEAGRKEVCVYVELTKDNHYRVIDLLKVRQMLDKGKA